MIRAAKLRSFRGMARFTPPVETSRHETEPGRFVVRELPNCWVSITPSDLRTPRPIGERFVHPSQLPPLEDVPPAGEYPGGLGVRFEI